MARSVCVPAVYFVPVWVGESACGEGKMSHPHSRPVCAVMSAMQHSAIFSRSQYCLCCVSPRLPRLFACLFDERITGAAGNRRIIF